MDLATFWTAVGSVATVLLAIGTFYMAWQTQRLAKETLQTEQQSDRHHHESLMPILKCTELNAEYRGGIHLMGYVINCGVGPALNVKVTAGSSIGEERVRNLGAVGVGESTLVDFQWFAVAPNDSPTWTMVIDYSNVFGEYARTTYASNEIVSPFIEPPKYNPRTTLGSPSDSPSECV